MLDIGFRPDIEKILRRCPKQRQTMLLSATVPPPIERLARRYMRAYKALNFSAQDVAVETIEHEVAELDNIFGILVLGAFIGIPSPPIHITMELLPLMDKEMDIMLDKVLTAHDPLGHLFSVLGID